MAGTNWNPDVSPSKRPTGVMAQRDGNFTRNYSGEFNIHYQDGIPYGDQPCDCCGHMHEDCTDDCPCV